MNTTRVTPLYALTHRVRWRIFAFLFAFACIAYFQQKGVTVAADRMMPELGLSQMQIGWVEWAFVLGYASFQFPGGVIGQRLGARRMFIVIGLIAFAATLLVPLAPLALGGTPLFIALLCLQLLLGVAQGPIFPVGSGVMESWFRPERWALIQGAQSMGLQFAAALTPPLIAYLMAFYGWQHALFWPAIPVVAVVVLWAWYGRNTPAEHPSVSAEELAELRQGSLPQPQAPVSWQRLGKLLTDRSILLLGLSYTCMNYVYYLIGNWCFLYLVQVRHVDILEGGWLAAAPPFAAAFGAGIGGTLAAELCARFGVRWGFRLVPVIALPMAGLLLLVAMHWGNAYGAVLALALCYASVELTEGSYWAGTMFIARSDTMSATGILNTGGNIGGLIGIPIVAYLSGHGQWNTAFLIGVVFAVLGAVAWLGVDTARCFGAEEEMGRSNALGAGGAAIADGRQFG